MWHTGRAVNTLSWRCRRQWGAVGRRAQRLRRTPGGGGEGGRWDFPTAPWYQSNRGRREWRVSPTARKGKEALIRFARLILPPSTQWCCLTASGAATLPTHWDAGDKQVSPTERWKRSKATILLKPNDMYSKILGPFTVNVFNHKVTKQKQTVLI